MVRALDDPLIVRYGPSPMATFLPMYADCWFSAKLAEQHLRGRDASVIGTTEQPNPTTGT